MKQLCTILVAGSLLLGDGSGAAKGTLSAAMTFQIGASASEKMGFTVAA